MKLVQIVPPTLTEYRLYKSTLILGSNDEADIQVEGEDIYAKHAVIWENRGLYAISDWAKQGGLWVNTIAVVSGQALRANDEIKLGKTVLKFLPDNASATPSQADDPSALPQDHFEVSTSLTEKLSHVNPEIRAQLRLISLCPSEKIRPWQKQYFRRMKNFGKLRKRMLFQPKIKTHTNLKRETIISPIDKCRQKWFDYTQTAFLSAYHVIENTAFQNKISADISNIDFATAWVSQIITVLFEYQQFLENEWIEYTLLRLIDDAVADSVITRHVFDEVGKMIDEKSAEFIETRRMVLEESQEEIDLEILQNKQALGVNEVKKRWAKNCPYARPLQHRHKKYTTYRREVFLAFLEKEGLRLPRQIGAYVWGKFYENKTQNLAQFKADRNILTNLSFENKETKQKKIPLWKAKIGFCLGGQYYLIDVAYRDERGRLLAFVPGKPDDSGEPLVLIETENGKVVDQQGRAIVVEQDGTIEIQSPSGITRKKQLRPTPNSIIKSIISAIIYENKILNGQKNETQLASAKLKDVPITLNWDTQSTRSSLLNIISAGKQKDMPSISLFKTSRAMQCAMHPMFFSPISGALFFRYLNFEAISGYQNLLKRNIVMQNNSNIVLTRLVEKIETSKERHALLELSAEAKGIRQNYVSSAIKNLEKYKIIATNSDLILIYLTIAHQQYKTKVAVQRNIAKLRLNQNEALVEAIENMWRDARKKPNTIIWLQNTLGSALDGAIYPQLFRNINVDFSEKYDDLLKQMEVSQKKEKVAVLDSPKKDFLRTLNQSLAYLKMLKQIVRQKQNPSSAALSVLVAFSNDTAAIKLLPTEFGGTTIMKTPYELFSMIGDIVPVKFTSRMMPARENNVSRPLIWSVVLQLGGEYTLILRDSRQPVVDLANAGYEKEAQLITQDTLDVFVSGFNRFMEILIQI